MQYTDFSLRAWQAAPGKVQVIVHSSPAGDMRRPVQIDVAPEFLVEQQQRFFDRDWYRDFANTAEIVEFGRTLANLLLPMPVFTLLMRSLDQLGSNGGLRIRLCLDDSLMDLPWEFLYRPDYSDRDRLDGFLALEPRISLVREAPLIPFKLRPSTRQERLVFAGTLWANGLDHYLVHDEYVRLQASLEPVADMLKMEFITSLDGNVAAALRRPTSIFHYAGHADVTQNNGYLVQEILDNGRPDPIWCAKLATYLRRAGVRLAVLNACNGGQWSVVEPFLRQGLPALIGIQGNVVNDIAIEFSATLYRFLALGVALDEAVSAARLHLLEIEDRYGVVGWSLGAYIVYMPTRESILFPRPQNNLEIRERQEKARQQSKPIINNYIFGPQTNIAGNVHTEGGLFNSGEVATRGGDLIAGNKMLATQDGTAAT